MSSPLPPRASASAPSSLRGRLVVLASLVTTSLGIWYITSEQAREKARMHRAVEVDKARLRQIEEEQRRAREGAVQRSNQQRQQQ